MAKKDKLVPVTCEGCGKTITWTSPGAKAWCRKCKQWVTAPPEREVT